MADNETPVERQEPAKTEKQTGKPKKEKKETEGSYAPLLIEFMVTLSAIILVGLFFIVVGISLFTGATLLDFVIRTGTSILVVGILLVILIRQISSGLYGTDTAKESMEQNQLDANPGIEMQIPSKVK